MPGKDRNFFAWHLNFLSGEGLYDSIKKSHYWREYEKELTERLTRELLVVGIVSVTFTFNDLWDFEKNPSYGSWRNLFREKLPSITAGCGTPYIIYGSLGNNIRLSVTQSQ